jgi:hypothetical protein
MPKSSSQVLPLNSWIDGGIMVSSDSSVLVSFEADPSAEDDIHSDLQRLDAHVIQPEEYEEIPELSELDPAEAVIRRRSGADQGLTATLSTSHSAVAGASSTPFR